MSLQAMLLFFYKRKVCINTMKYDKINIMYNVNTYKRVAETGVEET